MQLFTLDGCAHEGSRQGAHRPTLSAWQVSSQLSQIQPFIRRLSLRPLAFSNALRLELMPFGVHVTTVNQAPSSYFL